MKELIIQVIAVSIGASLAFLYWLIQHYYENKEKKEDDKNRRFNYINDLIIEVEQNQELLQLEIAAMEYNKKNSTERFEGLNTGNIRKFENHYHLYFLFNKENRTFFHKAMNSIFALENRQVEKVSPAHSVVVKVQSSYNWSDIAINAKLDLLKKFKTFLNVALTNDNNFNFIASGEDLKL